MLSFQHAQFSVRSVFCMLSFLHAQFSARSVFCTLSFLHAQFSYAQFLRSIFLTLNFHGIDYKPRLEPEQIGLINQLGYGVGSLAEVVASLLATQEDPGSNPSLAETWIGWFFFFLDQHL